jgi:threonine synthase
VVTLAVMKLIDSVTQFLVESSNLTWRSPSGNPLDLIFEATFDLGMIQKRKPNLWRYREALPIEKNTSIVSLDEGFTPLLFINFNGTKVGIKQEQLFSTGSYKDRGATVLMSHVKSLGISNVIQDSSGNAGCSIAAYAALAKIGCTIYLQNETSPSKTAQIKAYGSNISFIEGTREDVAEATMIAAETIYYASHCWNPFFFHGTKTFAYEVCEQLNWKAPDAVVLPAGNGTLLIGCYIGFTDLLKAGIISKMPKLIAVQSEHCAPLAKAFFAGQKTYSAIETSQTIAEGIAIAKPARGNQLLSIVQESKGHFITVSEHEIKEAWKECAQKGYYIEPTSAATIAGVKTYLKNSAGELVISLFSGHGLKSTDKILQLLR